MRTEIKQKNIQIFNQTVTMCSEHPRLREAIRTSIEKQHIYWEGDTVPLETPLYGNPAKVFLSSKRTVEAAASEKYKGSKIGILNFASSINPGGGVLRGTTTQEESICRISTLYSALTDEVSAGQFYKSHREWIHKGTMGRKNRDDCIYIPNIMVFREDDYDCKILPEKEWFTVDVLTCAAPDQRYDPTGNVFCPTPEELRAVMEKRIDHILRIASYQKIDALILGAFGCGAFGNSPTVVAKAFETVMKKYLYYFKTIEFAVYSRSIEDMNYSAFSQIEGIRTCE